MGIPFVTADVGDRRELLGSPPAGGLAIDDSAEALAEELLTVLTNPETACVYRLLGRERVKEAYWDKRVLLFKEVYKSCPSYTRSEVS
jgi:glycosyltransferase involved in cell wall biosynthesis